MKVAFFASAVDYELSYETEARFEGKDIVINDESYPNTELIIRPEEEGLYLLRRGKIEMEQYFDTHKKTEGHYKNDLGLAFSMDIVTHQLQINKDDITLEYQTFIDGAEQSKIKIYIKFN